MVTITLPEWLVWITVGFAIGFAAMDIIKLILTGKIEKLKKQIKRFNE